MKFLKWIWIFLVLGALAGMGSALAKKKKIQAIKEETKAKKKKAEIKKEAAVAKAKGVTSVSDGRGSIARMLDRARRRKRPDN